MLFRSGGDSGAPELAILHRVNKGGHPAAADRDLVRLGLELGCTLNGGIIQPDVRDVKLGESAAQPIPGRRSPRDSKQDGLTIEQFLTARGPGFFGDQVGHSDALAPAPDAGGGVEGFDVSPDGRELWAANADDGTVSIIDIASKKVIATLTFPGTVLANRLRFTPDGKTVLISYLRSGELIAIDAASRKLIKQLKVDSGAAGILLSPDGATAYVGVGRDNKVVAVDVKTMTIAREIPTGKGPDGMAWLPRN